MADDDWRSSSTGRSVCAILRTNMDNMFRFLVLPLWFWCPSVRGQVIGGIDFTSVIANDWAQVAKLFNHPESCSLFRLFWSLETSSIVCHGALSWIKHIVRVRSEGCSAETFWLISNSLPHHARLEHWTQTRTGWCILYRWLSCGDVARIIGLVRSRCFRLFCHILSKTWLSHLMRVSSMLLRGMVLHS